MEREYTTKLMKSITFHTNLNLFVLFAFYFFLSCCCCLPLHHFNHFYFGLDVWVCCLFLFIYSYFHLFFCVASFFLICCFFSFVLFLYSSGHFILNILAVHTIVFTILYFVRSFSLLFFYFAPLNSN